MFKRILKRGAIAAALIVSIYPQISVAKEFTSADFLKWEPESQSFYFRTSIGMAGLIAGLNNDQQAKCIDDWYFADMKNAEKVMIGVMRDNSSYHPRGVILGVLQKKCGAFRY